MGNRAVVTVEGSKVGVYLHWNGGVESVEAFLKAAKDLGVRAPTGDTSYFYSRFAQIVGNFLGGNTSVGIDSLDSLDCDNGDNGQYIIGADFKIVARKHAPPHADMAANPATVAGIYAEVMAVNQSIFQPEKVPT